LKRPKDTVTLESIAEEEHLVLHTQTTLQPDPRRPLFRDRFHLFKASLQKKAVEELESCLHRPFPTRLVPAATVLRPIRTVVLWAQTALAAVWDAV
jgi:hypothetical protein